MDDMNEVVFRDLLHKTNYKNCTPLIGRTSGGDKTIKNNLDDVVRRILILDDKLKGKGIGKITSLSNIIDLYTRLEILLGLKLSSHTNTPTEASNLIDEL